MQRVDNVEQFTAGEGAICRKRQRQRKHGLVRTPYVSPTKPVRLRRSKAKGNIDGAQTVAEAGCVNLGINYRNVNIAPAINADTVSLETRSVQSTERLTAEWVSVTEFHKFDKFGHTDSRYNGHTDSKPNTRNSKSETPAIIDQPKPLGFGRVKNYVEKINRYNEKEIPDGRRNVVKDYLKITTNGTPKKNYCLVPKPFKSQHSTNNFRSLSEKAETSVIGQTIEQCKSFVNRDEFTENKADIEQSISIETQDEFIKSKPDTEFNGLLNQFTLDEQQHTSTKYKKIYSDKTKSLYSKLDGENGKDKLEILSTSHYAHDLAISQDVNYLDTAESALPKTYSETVAFKIEAEDKVNSSFEGKDDDKIIETRSHCSRLCSPTLVKQRSDDTDIAEPIKYETPQHTSVSDESTSEIGQTIEQCKSFVNGDEFTGNIPEIEQLNFIVTQDEFIKSKPDTEFNGLLHQFTLDEQQQTSTKDKNLHTDKTNDLYSKLDGENGEDKLEILPTSHYAHDLAISQDVNYLDTAESAFPKTNSETVAFKIEAKDKVNSSFEGKDDDKIIETRSHCSQLCSPTLVKQRSGDTDIAEPIKYETPQHTSISDESTSEIGQTIEQCKSFANRDEFTENKSEIEQSNSIVTQDEFIKSKPGTEFNGLLHQFTLDEQQQTSTKDKNLHYVKTNDLYSKLDEKNGEDKLEILSTSHYAHDIAISQDVNSQDTAESALPKTISETVAFKIEAKDKVNSSFEGKDDDKIIETRSHCSRLCSPTLVKQRSDDTDIAEPIKYETPQHTSVSDESTSEIGQTIEQCKSFVNGDEFTENISEIEQLNSIVTQDEFIKSKPDTEFNGLLHQLTLDEQQQTSTKDKNLHSDKTNGLYSKLDGENGKDNLEILSTSHYAHDLAISQDVNYLDTAESALPKTYSETVAFKIEAEDKVNSSFEGKDDDKIIETRSHCSQLCSPTLVKQRSDDTDIAEPIKYETPQHISVSDESISREFNGSKLYGGNKVYLNSFVRKHCKEGLKYTSVGNLSTDKAEEHSGDFVHVFSNAVNSIKSIDTHSDATGIKPIQNAESDLMKDIIIKENEACFREDFGQFVGNKLDYRSDEEIFIENQSELAIVGMLHVNQVASSENDLDSHRLSSEWKSGSQAETVSETERNKETVVNDDKDLSTTKARQTPNPDGQGARPKDSQSYRPGIRTNNRYPARSNSGGQQYSSPVIDSRTQTGWRSDDSIERRGSQSLYSGVSCDCSFHLNRAKPVSANQSGHILNRTSESNQSYLTGVSEGPVCRICQDGDDQEVLVSPCYCAGSLGLLHVSCLQKWLGASNKTDCEICGFEFMVERKPMPISHFIRDPGSVADRRNIICDLVCVSLITPLTVATSYLCVSGAMNYYVKDSWERTGLLLLSGVLMGLYLLWLMVMLKHNYNLWQDWKMFHQEVTLLAAPKTTVNNNTGRGHSKDPVRSCRSKSSLRSSIDKVKLQSVKISVCGPMGRHRTKDGMGSPRLSPGPGKSHHTVKSLPNLPPIYRSPSSKGSTKRSSQSPSSSRMPLSIPSKDLQTPSKCSVLTATQEWQNTRGSNRTKYLVKQGRDLQDEKNLGESPKTDQPTRHLRNFEQDRFNRLNEGMTQVLKQERRLLKSDRARSPGGLKRKSLNSVGSPVLAQALDEIVQKSPENAELSSIICIYKQTENKNDRTADTKMGQKIETKNMTTIKGYHKQFTDAEVFSRGNSPMSGHTRGKSDRPQTNPAENISGTDTLSGKLGLDDL